MSELTPQAQIDKQVEIVKPNDDDFLAFSQFRQGLTTEQIGELHGVTPQAINARLRKVKNFLGPAWERFTLQDMKLAYDKVKPKWESRIEQGSDRLIGQYMDRMVYPDKSGPQVAVQINADRIVDGVPSDAYDVNVKIVEGKADDE